MKKRKIAGWIVSGLVAAFLILASAPGKFIEWEGKAEMFEYLGYSSQTIFALGIVEVTVALLFLIPRSAFVGAILLTAYLGGATATHIRVGDPYYLPIILGVAVWIALGLRRPEVFQLAFGIGPPNPIASDA